MRRSVSYYESRIDLTEQQRTRIREKLGNDADRFIEVARVVGGEYRSKSVAWSGPAPAEVRRRVENLGNACADARAALEALDPAAREQIRRGQQIDQIKARATDAAGEALPQELARSTETELEDLDIALTRIESACRRATKFSALNQGQGKDPDHARLTLIRELGDAYTTVTGKKPAQRSGGEFASIARVILEAAGAQSGLSNDTLRRLFGPVR